MRILLNGLPMLGRRTGVGQYTLRLLQGLRGSADIADVDVFDGTDVIAAPAFLEAIDQVASAGRNERWKQRLRCWLPYCRELAAGYRATRFGRATRRGRWTVYHEPNYVAQRFGGTVVTTVCDLSFFRCPEFLPRDRRQWLKRELAASLQRSQTVIAISEFTRREILEWFPRIAPERVVVTPLGVDEDYQPAADVREDPDQVRDWFGLPPKFILCLGTLEPRKNLQGLVRAFRELPPDIQREYPLVLAGTHGWREHYFRSSVNELKRQGMLYELGYIDRACVPVLLRAATLFCFPSFYEGFGLPPLEAAACGTPVVCSNAASLPEVMGDAAVLADPHSPQELAAAMLRVLDDEQLRGELRSRGPRRAAEFTWKQCVFSTVAAYREAA